jgi:hypothetical protein
MTIMLGSIRLHRSLLAASFALVISAGPASAQLGGWVKKKVAERVVDRADKAVDRIAPTSGPGTAFTAEELDRVLSSLELTAAARDRADSLTKLADPLQKRVSEIHQTRSEEINTYNKAKLKLSECRAAYVKSKSTVDDAKNKAALEKLMPTLLADQEKARQFGQEGVQMQRAVHEAVTRGNEAEANRLQAAYYKKWGLDVGSVVSEADLARHCGGPTPVPPVLAERDSLQHLIADLESRRRAAQAAVQDSARIKSGLPQQQYFVMSERVERWYAIAVRNQNGPRFWSDEENALFEARRARIERVFARRG